MDVAGFWNNVGINLEHRKFSNQEMAHVHISVRHHNNIHLLQYNKPIHFMWFISAGTKLIYNAFKIN